MVKLHDSAQLPHRGDAQSRLAAYVGDFSSVLRRFAPSVSLPLEGLFNGLTLEQLQELQRRAAERNPSEELPDLTKYFTVRCPEGIEPREVAAGVLSLAVVEDAYEEPLGTNPAVKPDDDHRSGFQGYLDPAPLGIDAKFAWGVRGGDGEGQRAIDLERGWTLDHLDHEDLAAHRAKCLLGTLEDEPRWHGTCVLGVLCAVDNTAGCVGICPNISSINVVSYVDVGIANAIAFAAHALTNDGAQGDVLILEVQDDDWLPVEIDRHIFDTIKIATSAGVIVIEAAGNAGKNLDEIKDTYGRKVLNRTSNDFRDSGAIMVGAATSDASHRRIKKSNYGNRIDCFAWGGNIYTTYSDSPTNTSGYTPSFNRTSGATPIVAGAVVCIQRIAAARTGRRFSSLEMRSILKDVTVNTPSGKPSKDRIGVMPNLRGIIKKHFTGV